MFCLIYSLDVHTSALFAMKSDHKTTMDFTVHIISITIHTIVFTLQRERSLFLDKKEKITLNSTQIKRNSDYEKQK